MAHFFADQVPLAELPTDPEANPENFMGSRQVARAPAKTPMFVGLRLQLTRNINKETDFVNGMGAVVLGVHQGATGVRVRTDTGFVLVVFPWTDVADDGTRATFLPCRVGYANTLMKLQGATLEHMTVWLDVANIEAAGYVALSRVQRDRDWRFVGDPTRHHFTPARAI